ncbi:MAG: transposase [Thermofilum sp.]|nr:transposase [Thermofilum sp.]
MHRVENAVRGHAVRGLEPRALELEIPRFEREVVPVGKAPSNRAGLGFRVYKPRVSKVNRERLKALYNDVINYILGVVHELKGSKYLAYYADEWVEMYENAKRVREEAGKRTLPKTPPVLVPVRFVMPDGRERGNRNAPAVIDLRKGELRIPSYGIAQKLRRSLVRALIEENSLEPRPDFVLMVTRRGFLRLIASRYVRASVALPLRIIAIDENSLNGEALAAWDVLKPGRIVRSRYEELMPRNRGFLDRMAALFQGAAAGKAGALEEVKELLREAERSEAEIAALLAPKKLAEIAAKTLEREKRLNRAFAEELVSLVRKLVREAKERGWSVAIAIDPINAESLKGSELQRTLLKPRKLLRNLARYEGARFKLYRVSGKQCPNCGEIGVEVGHRRYKCPRCGIEWDRDKCATFWLAKRFLDEHFKEECGDETYVDLDGWLRKHPRGLL